VWITADNVPLPPQLDHDYRRQLRSLQCTTLFARLGADPFSCLERTFNMRLAAAMHWRWRRLSVGGDAASFRRSLRTGVVGSLLGLLAGAPAWGQGLQPSEPAPQPASATAPQPAPATPTLSPQQIMRAKLNQDTLIVAASRPGTAYLAMANDLSSAVGSNGGVRVLPVAADGGLANLRDALFLRGVDLTIVPANVLAHAKASNAFGGGLQQRLAYVTLLYSEEVHVVAGSGIATVGDLAGKRVAVPTDDGTAQFTLGDICQRLGITVDSVPMAPADALDEVRAGTVAAAVLVGGKPLDQVSALPKDGSLRLLSLPFANLPADAYAPAVLRAEDYPALIPPDTMVETVAVSAVLVTVKGEEAARRVAKHTPAVLDAIAKLAISERHPKWRDVNLGAVLPGWSRAEAAETWLRHASAERKGALDDSTDEPPRADSRVKAAEPAAATRRKKLMAEFDAWARKSAANGETTAK
jgi:uncharacterized protein